jgi:hypothetical protein
LTEERIIRAQEGLAAARATGKMPLEIVLTVMRGGPEAEDVTERQYRAAVDAMPYVHARLASAVVTHRDGLDDLNVDDLRSLLAAAERATWLAGGENQDETGATYSGKPN